jgi:hypothetical protein
MPCSDVRYPTIAMCLSSPQAAMICCHSAIERPYFFSMDGKYDAGPCFGHGGACSVMLPRPLQTRLIGVDGLVWYVSYGSNMDAGRFRYYLEGGRPPHAKLSFPGARDPSPPRDTRPVWLAGRVYFATLSRVWGGGRALYDPDLDGRAAARSYLITAGQFADVVAQEMYREPGADLDLTTLAGTGRLRMGDGRYETLVCPGHCDDAPLITFTAPWRMSDMDLLAPSPAYLRMIGLGLREAHGWDTAAVTRYLAGLPGVHGAWRPGEIAALLTAPGTEPAGQSLSGNILNKRLWGPPSAPTAEGEPRDGRDRLSRWPRRG